MEPKQESERRRDIEEFPKHRSAEQMGTHQGGKKEEVEGQAKGQEQAPQKK